MTNATALAKRLRLFRWNGTIEALPLAAADALDSLSQRLAAAELERDEAAAENDKFRAMWSNSPMPCIYCDLSAVDQAKCQSGFPGCGRADDQLMCPHFAAELSQAERAEAAERRNAELASALAQCAAAFMVSDAAGPGGLISREDVFREFNRRQQIASKALAPLASREPPTS